MPDPTSVLARLKKIAAQPWYVDTQRLFDDAVALIELLTRPMTLEECRDVLNANEHLFGSLGEEADGSWVVSYGGLFNGFDSLTLFEATAIARAYLLQKEAARG